MERYTEINRIVRQQAKRYGKRWPGVGYTEFVQQGWVYALEVLNKSPSISTSLLSGILKTKLLNFACVSVLPVRAPKNNEHKYLGKLYVQTSDVSNITCTTTYMDDDVLALVVAGKRLADDLDRARGTARKTSMRLLDKICCRIADTVSAPFSGHS